MFPPEPTPEVVIPEASPTSTPHPIAQRDATGFWNGPNDGRDEASPEATQETTPEGFQLTPNIANFHWDDWDVVIQDLAFLDSIKKPFNESVVATQDTKLIKFVVRVTNTGNKDITVAVN